MHQIEQDWGELLGERDFAALHELLRACTRPDLDSNQGPTP